MIEKDDKKAWVERSIITKFRKTIWAPFLEALRAYRLISPGDRIAVCISGGKDSMLLAKLMQELKRHSDYEFGLEFICMDPGYNRENVEKIKSNAALLGVPVRFFKSDVFEAAEIVGGDSPCYMCARMRRGYLYARAEELGCNKIALGHHRSDVIETTLMGMFYGGQIQGMMPRLKSNNFKGMELIRPMYCISEEDIEHWREYNGLEFIACASSQRSICERLTPPTKPLATFSNTGKTRRRILFLKWQSSKLVSSSHQEYPALFNMLMISDLRMSKSGLANRRAPACDIGDGARSPSRPAPRLRRIKTLSAASSAWWAWRPPSVCATPNCAGKRACPWPGWRS